MLNQRQVGNMFGLFARFVGAGRFSAASMPMVAVIAVAVSTVHGFERPGEVHPSVVAALEGTSHDAPAGGNAVMNELRRHLSRATVTAMHRPMPVEPAAAGAEVRPPLKLSAEQRNIANFVSSKYRIAVDDVQHFVAHAYHAAREFRLDPYLILAIVSIESSFNPNARSPKGAQGLMQVLTRVHSDKFAPFGGVTAAFDPVANLTVGSAILKQYLVREGSVEGALKSYVGAALLPHDFGYGQKVLSERERIAAAARGGPIPGEPMQASAPKPSQAGAADALPAVARVAPGSGTPSMPKTIGAVPALAALDAAFATDLLPRASTDLAADDAVAQLVRSLAEL